MAMFPPYGRIRAIWLSAGFSLVQGFQGFHEGREGGSFVDFLCPQGVFVIFAGIYMH